MSQPVMKKIGIYTTCALVGLAFGTSMQTWAADKVAKNDSLPIQSLRTMAEVYGQVKANYVTAETDEKLLENAIKGMVSGLDPHSEYMNKKGYGELQESTSGEFGGVGMEIGAEDGMIKVISPIEDTPAERAGIKSGDFIMKINNQSTRGMSSTDAVKLMRGKPGTKVTLTLARKDVAKPIVVNLTRAIIKVKSVRHHLLEPDYGYVRVSQFQERTVPSVVESIQELSKQNKRPLKGMILDLRDDPGGLLTGAVGVSAVFLKAGDTVVSTKGRNNKPAMLLKALPQDYTMGMGKDPLVGLPNEIKTMPITVLINSGSASASEIVAGALQDHKRAVIVGTRSFGKGSVQSVIPLSNGGAVKFTTALYYTPNDRSIQAVGIVPDVEVKDKDRLFEAREADLGGHIGNPLGEDDVKGGVVEDAIPKTEKEKKDKKDEDISSRRIPNPAKDDQLRKALELIKNPTEWQKSLGLAAKKPVETKKSEE